MRLAWLTDIHLNFLPYERVDAFLNSVQRAEPDGVVITGDISEAHDLAAMLVHIDDALARPLYVVLGNHDFYHGSIHAVRDTVAGLAGVRPNLHYLTIEQAPFELTAHTAIIGDDGWADARLGDYERSQVMMHDYRLIAELAGLNKLERWSMLQLLGDAAADHIRNVLPAALDRYEQVILATHVPPLREACWHEGNISDDEWAPHFTCKAMGDAILQIARDYPQRQITVLCGHTHSPGECRPLPNVRILTGGAKYGHPAIQQVLEVL